jgi:PadR family transcriptional regulator, regulatory protein AphA
MNVRTLCLSILHEGEATGYEIRRLCVEGECAYFVEASFGSIYPALTKLENDGLVTSRIEHQEGKPSKKIYAITAQGRKAFVDALMEPMGEDVFRSPFLLFARFVHLLPADWVGERLSEQLRNVEAKLALLEKAQAGPCGTPADRWVLNYGFSVLRQSRQYLLDHMDELVALARPVVLLAAE